MRSSSQAVKLEMIRHPFALLKSRSRLVSSPDPTPKGGKDLVLIEQFLGLADVAFLNSVAPCSLHVIIMWYCTIASREWLMHCYAKITKMMHCHDCHMMSYIHPVHPKKAFDAYQTLSSFWGRVKMGLVLWLHPHPAHPQLAIKSQASFSSAIKVQKWPRSNFDPGRGCQYSRYIICDHPLV